jgi:hypothetical protein
VLNFEPFSLFEVDEEVEFLSEDTKWYRGVIHSVDLESSAPNIERNDKIFKKVSWNRIRKLKPFTVGENIEFKSCCGWWQGEITSICPPKFKFWYFFSKDIKLHKRNVRRFTCLPHPNDTLRVIKSIQTDDTTNFTLPVDTLLIILAMEYSKSGNLRLKVNTPNYAWSLAKSIDAPQFINLDNLNYDNIFLEIYNYEEY